MKKPMLKLYLKILLVIFIVNFLGAFLFGRVGNISIGQNFVMNLIVGACVCLIPLFLHKRNVEKVSGEKISEDNLSVCHTKNITSKINKEELLRRLGNDEKFRKMKIEEKGNSIIIKSGVSWKSWGEKIQIEMTPIANEEFNYKISSEPNFRLTMMDYGKNLENVKEIESIINA